MGGPEGNRGNGRDIIDNLVNHYVHMRLDETTLPAGREQARFCIGKITAYDSTHIQLNPYLEYDADLDSPKDTNVGKLKKLIGDIGNSNNPTTPEQYKKKDISAFGELIIIIEEDD